MGLSLDFESRRARATSGTRARGTDTLFVMTPASLADLAGPASERQGRP